MNGQKNAEITDGNHELASVTAEEYVPVKLQLNFPSPLPFSSHTAQA